MSVHVAILKKPYLDAILRGTKTIESRLSKTAGPPFGRVEAGERVYLKQSAGPVRGMATAEAVFSQDGLTPRDVQAIRRRFEPRVGGDDAYWRGRVGCRFATMISLSDVEPCDVGPRYRTQHMRAWYVLPNDADPVREVRLKPGAVRHGYVPLPRNTPTLQDATVTLVLPDGVAVETDSYKGQRFRWRGWRRYFDEQGVGPGDRVRLTVVRPRRYRVSFPDSS